MKNLLHVLFSLVALFVCGGHAAGEEAEASRQFNIELLIFQNLIDNDAGEVWPVDYSTWFNEVAESPVQPLDEPLAVTWLPEESFHLTAERNALGSSSRYRPLAYLAWRQPAYDRSRARPLTLPAPENTGNAYVDGTVRVAVERYLHLYLDLQLHLPVGAVQPETGEVELPEIRLTEKRRMRSQEIHYFDNPRFGVIALITPYEPPATPTATDEGAAPATQP
jgi:hypothetical protein